MIEFFRRQEQDQLRKGTDSPLFTPTVVMKKMAADRRDSDPKPLIPELKVSEAAKRTSPMQPMGGMPAGPPAPPPPAAAIFGQPAIHGMTGPQQQQQLIFMQQQIRAQQLAALQVRKVRISAIYLLISTVYLLFQASQHMDPRLLMQAQLMGQPAGPPMPGSPRHPMPPSAQVPPHPGPPGPPRGFMPPVGNAGDGLSRFFSPEVLAQAQAGNAPPLPPLPTQKAMTLEEIERQAATVRI